MGSRHAAHRENDAVRVICKFRLEVVVQSCYWVERRNFQPESPGYHMDIFESRDNDLSDTRNHTRRSITPLELISCLVRPVLR